MTQHSKSSSIILGLSILLSFTVFGLILKSALLDFREYERTVTVKGLSEREYQADIVIWPIQFAEATNDLELLYDKVEKGTRRIKEFLIQNGIAADEISHRPPAITDKSANAYGSAQRAPFRYTAVQTVTVYSKNIAAVRKVMEKLADLGKTGIAFTRADYEAQTEYLFTRLNEVKPEMIEEATRKAREVAEKFASDSKSSLGKIKRAAQGQFSIRARDKNNPHIKKVRVVSTIEYYLSD